MKIGIDGRGATWYRGTGIGTYTYQLVENLRLLDSSSNKYFVLSPEKKIDTNFSDNVINCVIPYKKNTIEEKTAILNTISENSIDLYHVPQNGIGIPIDELKQKGTLLTITLHDVIPFTKPHTVSESYLKTFTENVPKIVNAIDAIITVSNYSKEDISRILNVSKDKIFVTHLAAEPIYIPLNKLNSKQYIAQKYAIKNDYILYVGGFSTRKNIISIIESFYIIHKKLSKPKILVLAGKEKIECENLHKRIHELGLQDYVIFPGEIPVLDMPYLYNASSLVLYPSLYEGFGLPPLEAMACGIPVITSNVTSIPEVVQDGAITIPPLDIQLLSDKIYEVLEDDTLYKSLVNKALKISSNFSWKKTTEETVKIYEQIKRTNP